MICDYEGVGQDIKVTIGSYYPSGRLVTNARYWRRFGGGAPVGYSFSEYVFGVAELINMITRNKLCLLSVHEPQSDHEPGNPCRFRYPDAEFISGYSPLIPQYLIIVAQG
jgi:hypothetical protein